MLLPDRLRLRLLEAEARIDAILEAIDKQEGLIRMLPPDHPQREIASDLLAAYQEILVSYLDVAKNLRRQIGLRLQ